VTLELAAAVGPTGRVVGIDIDEGALAIARHAAQDKLLLAELVDNMRETMLASEAATASDLDEIRGDVERAARDPERVLYQARIHQVWGRRPD
jgi:tRNA A58 N-methylase Trm61